MTTVVEWSAPATLAKGLVTVEFNPVAGGDGFYLREDTTGLGGAPIRATVDDAAQTDGGVVHDNFKGARHLTIVAEYLIATGDIADRNAAFDALDALLDSIMRADGTWTMTPTGAAAQSLTVRCDVSLSVSGGAQLKRATFGLVAADPNWS